MERIVKVCKALGDESRAQLLHLLLKHPYCVKALAKQIHISPSAVSQHLRVLKEAGLVKGKREGYWVHYSVNREEVEDFLRRVEDFFATEREGESCCRENLAETKED